MIFNSTQNGDIVTFAYFGDHDPNGQAAACAQAAGKEIRFVVELFGCGKDQALSLSGNGIGNRRSIQHQRNSGRRQPEVVR